MLVWPVQHTKRRAAAVFCRQAESIKSLTSGPGATHQFGNGKTYKTHPIKKKIEDKTGENENLDKKHIVKENPETRPGTTVTHINEQKETTLSRDEV